MNGIQSKDWFSKVLLTLLVIGVWGLLLRPAFQASPAKAQTRARTQPVRWEYLRAEFNRDLNGLGKQGWEAVLVIPGGDLLLKRRL